MYTFISIHEIRNVDILRNIQYLDQRYLRYCNCARCWDGANSDLHADIAKRPIFITCHVMKKMSE